MLRIVEEPVIKGEYDLDIFCAVARPAMLLRTDQTEA
jgi:hypothetical protein